VSVTESAHRAAPASAGRGFRWRRSPARVATYFIVEPNRAQLVELARLAEADELTPAIDSVFPLDDASAAFARVAERGKRGKVVLRVGDD
jgi:NADPH:quinone reductase-like Zn-dependent oxidoreductase